MFPDSQYDITLLLEPSLPSVQHRGQTAGCEEALRVTKTGGIIFAAYVISDGCPCWTGFHRQNIHVAEYVKNGLLDRNLCSQVRAKGYI